MSVVCPSSDAVEEPAVGSAPAPVEFASAARPPPAGRVVVPSAPPAPPFALVDLAILVLAALLATSASDNLAALGSMVDLICDLDAFCDLDDLVGLEVGGGLQLIWRAR